MIDWVKYSVLPTEKTIDSYPTILDILDDVVAQAENNPNIGNPLDRFKSPILDGFNTKGNHVLIYNTQLNIPLLLPATKTMFTFFRGQNHYYKECLPTLYREQNILQETLRSQLQTAEMMQVMWTHPVINFINNRPLMIKGLPPIKLPIMYDGLAQHYGIKTKLIDLTNDIWTAAFFATTEIVDGTFKYVVVDENSSLDNRFGVLYKLDFSKENDCHSIDNCSIFSIGLQYFNRPGVQCASVRPMVEYRDFHDIPNLERVYFRHDNASNEMVFKLSMCEKYYFPDDPLADVVSTIQKHDRFCLKSVELARDIYYKNKDIVEFKREVIEAGFEITDNLNASFPKEEIEREWMEWISGGSERYIHNIKCLPLMKYDLIT